MKWILNLLFMASILFSSGCLVTSKSDAGYLDVKRDDANRIIQITFIQPKDSSEASTVVFNILTNGVVTGEAYMGTQQNRVGIAETFRALKPVQYTGIALALAGIAVLILRKSVPTFGLVKKRWAWIAIAAGAGFVFVSILFPMIVTKYGGTLLWVFIVAIASIAFYLAWQKQHPNKE